MTQQAVLHQIQTKVKQTQRRTFGVNLLHSLPICLSLFLLVATALAFVQTWFALQWPMLWVVAGSLVVALLSSVGYAFAHRPSTTSAALNLDAAFGLRERVTTALTLTAEQQQSAAGLALLDDTHTQLKELKVAERFPLQANLRQWVSPIGAALCVVLAVLFAPTPQMLQGQTNLVKQTSVTPPVQSLELKALQQSNEERRRRVLELDSEKLAQMQAEFDKLLGQADPENKNTEPQVKLMQMTRLEDMIRQRQEELSKSIDLKKQLQTDSSLKENDEGPAQALQQALAQGDMKKAQEEAKKLLDKLKNKELSDAEKKQLEQQMKNLANKLDDLAEQKKRKEAIEKSNADPETKQKELKKLEKEIAKLQDLKNLAEKMKSAQECMKNGNMEGAAENLQSMLEDLQDLNLEQLEMKELQIAENDLEELKECMGNCQGMGKGNREKRKGRDSDGYSESTDFVTDPTEGGRRKDQYNDTDSKDEKLSPQYDPKGKMRVIGQGPIQPKPEKDGVGMSTLELSSELSEANQQANEALRQQKVAPSQRDLVNDFYKNLNPKAKEPPAPKKP